MGIVVATDEWDDPLRSLIAEAYEKLRADEALGFYDGDTVQFGSHLVQCKARVMLLRGRRSITHNLYLDGRRRGFNDVRGKLKGKWK